MGGTSGSINKTGEIMSRTSFLYPSEYWDDVLLKRVFLMKF